MPGEYTHAAPIDQEHLSWGVSYAVHQNVPFPCACASRAPAVRSELRRRGLRQEGRACTRAPQNEAASTALEGQVDIVAWPGYIERGETDKNYDWVTKFEADTGCKVNVKTAGTSDEMVSLMTQGGYDLVTASGDASLRLIRGGTVQPVDISQGAVLRQRRPAPEGSAVALRRRQALRRAVSVGPERAHVQHQGVQEAADLVERGVRAAEARRTASRTRAACRPTTGRSTSPTPRCT